MFLKKVLETLSSHAIRTEVALVDTEARSDSLASNSIPHKIFTGNRWVPKVFFPETALGQLLHYVQGRVPPSLPFLSRSRCSLTRADRRNAWVRFDSAGSFAISLDRVRAISEALNWDGISSSHRLKFTFSFVKPPSQNLSTEFGGYSALTSSACWQPRWWCYQLHSSRWSAGWSGSPWCPS